MYPMKHKILVKMDVFMVQFANVNVILCITSKLLILVLTFIE